jgi:Subtilisin inhibitor-like
MRRWALGGVVVAVGMSALGGVSASAGAAGVGSESSLVITAYDPEDGARPVVAEVTVKCGPDGGSHPDPERACEALEAVDGDVYALEPLPQGCILIYQPVHVEVGGSWRDRVVSFEREYPNLCVAAVESAGVFMFRLRA